MPFVPDSGAAGAGAGAAVGAGIGQLMPAMSKQAIAATAAETRKLVEAAKSGGFRISEEGMKPLRDAVMKMQGQLDELGYTIDALEHEPKLGSHDYGREVAAHDQKAANAGAGSATAVVDQFRQVLRDADEALQRAAGIYQENEGNTAGNIGSVQI
ncbi:hypothetical protein [Qaidamihabitans albus]|uniref:hypothetical protein n=1 Tax=Qaidamihabitans albus TaxID=2795733 RepID=UPI0018F18F1C|nr:hypothetical protein [Qaidamihabitans albus]